MSTRGQSTPSFHLILTNGKPQEKKHRSHSPIAEHRHRRQLSEVTQLAGGGDRHLRCRGGHSSPHVALSSHFQLKKKGLKNLFLTFQDGFK